MNKHGQTLIIFVILIPIFLLLAAIVIDLGFIMNEKTKLSGVTTTILKEYYDKRTTPNIIEEMKLLYQKNKIPVKNIEIKIEETKITIKNNYEIDSIFGKVIGIKKYSVSIHKSITKESDTLKITKE